MAKDIFRTPLAAVRWAHLITPRHQLDKSKPKAWTADLLLPNGDEKGFPWKPDNGMGTPSATAPR